MWPVPGVVEVEEAKNSRTLKSGIFNFALQIWPEKAKFCPKLASICKKIGSIDPKMTKLWPFLFVNQDIFENLALAQIGL